MLAFFQIRYAKSRMVAYVNGELPPAARRRIARYIEKYPPVYSEYIQQRNAARELQWKLTTVGHGEKPTLDRMWSAIQAELNVDTPARRSVRLPNVNFQVRYGIMGLAMAFAIALPLSFGGNRTAFALSLSQPAPQTATMQPEEAATSMRNRLVVMLIVTEQAGLTPPAPAMPRATPVGTDAK